MMQGLAVLALWIDIDPAARDECDAWYVNRHIADRIAVPGWRRVRRFHAVGPTRPATLALYEVQRPEDLVSDDYLRLQRNVDATDIRMRAAFRNVVRDTFRVRHSTGTGEGGLMLSLRFQPNAKKITNEAAAQVVIAEVIPSVAALQGVVAVHLLQQAPELRDTQDGHRKSGSNDARAHWVLLVEATQGDRIDAVAGLLSRWPDGDGLGLKDGQIGVYDLMYAVQA